jgi:hypothetical protein
VGFDAVFNPDPLLLSKNSDNEFYVLKTRAENQSQAPALW